MERITPQAKKGFQDFTKLVIEEVIKAFPDRDLSFWAQATVSIVLDFCASNNIPADFVVKHLDELYSKL